MRSCVRKYSRRSFSVVGGIVVGGERREAVSGDQTAFLARTATIVDAWQRREGLHIGGEEGCHWALGVLVGGTVLLVDTLFVGIPGLRALVAGVEVVKVLLIQRSGRAVSCGVDGFD